MSDLSSPSAATAIPSGGVAVVGAGALGQQIAQHLTQNGVLVTGFYDDTQPVGTNTPNGPVLGPIQSAASDYGRGKFGSLLMGIGYSHLAARQRLFEELSAAGIPFATWVHPTAYVDPSAQLGPGCIVLAGSMLDINVQLGPNTFLYLGCIISHDTELAGHSFLAPGVRLAGNVRLAERCFLGIGTTVIDGRVLGPDVRTGGGTVVTRHLTAPGTYVGVPAKRLAEKGS